MSALIRPSPASPATSKALRTLSVALVAADEAVDPRRAEVDVARVRAPPSASIAQQRSAVVVVHPSHRRDPARRRLVVAGGKHRRDQLGRIACELGDRARSASPRARRSARAASFWSGSLPSPSSLRIARQPRVAVLADERLAQLPGVGLGKVAGVGRIVDRRIEVDQRLGREDAEAGGDQRRISRCCGASATAPAPGTREAAARRR